jgi:divalent metal cation (Fe/Co/Zn/Cd) transporter
MGVQLMRRSMLGLMDTALDPEEIRLIETILDAYRARGVVFHAFCSRQSGQRRFMSIHALTPGAWTVQCGHDLLEEIEQKIISAVPGLTVFTHLEPLEDPLALDDITLDRTTLDRTHSSSPN